MESLCVLKLTVTDPEVLAELSRQDASERDDYALGALRLGVLSLKQARGQVDANTLHVEGDKLLSGVESALRSHKDAMDRIVIGTLKEYFDSNSGRFQERVERLIRKDGELESLLARKVTSADSDMCRALVGVVGKDSPLFKLLVPGDSNEFLRALSQTVKTEQEHQRIQVLREFSLDNKAGALSRLVSELTDTNGKLRDGLQGKIDELIKQFSFNDEGSAISRMAKTVASINDTISKQLTMDSEASALSLLRREVLKVLKEHGEANQKFQEQVRVTLESMQARKEEAAASTRHGITFEAWVFETLQAEAHKLGDVATATGNSTGIIKNCKKGDVVVEMGPDSIAAGAKIVLEAKEDASYNLASALAEIDVARNNRESEVGVFVFSKVTAPEGLQSLARYGNDLAVVVDMNDPTTHIYLLMALSVARALCTRKAVERGSSEVDFSFMDSALLEISKQIEELDKIRVFTDTIISNGQKIQERLRISTDKLSKYRTVIADGLEDVKVAVSKKRK